MKFTEMFRSHQQEHSLLEHSRLNDDLITSLLSFDSTSVEYASVLQLALHSLL